MPAGLQVVNFFAQNIAGGGFNPLAPGTLDSATFFNVPQDTGAYLAEIWGVDDAGPALLSLTASRFHDPQIGILGAIPDGSQLAPVNRASNISPVGADQPIYPSDILRVQVDGTAGDNVNCTLVLYYPNLPGIDARLFDWNTIRNLVKNICGVQVTLTPGSGDWGASVALNSSQDLLHQGRDYAVLGFTSQAPLAAVALQGIDTGNLRVGGPVIGDPAHDAYLFRDLADSYGSPLIPVINANNAGAINLQAADPAAGATIVTVMLAELTTTV